MSSEINKRFRSCSNFKMMEGMLWIWPNGNTYRIGQVNYDEETGDVYPSNGWGDGYPDRAKGYPDTEDPATVGCLLKLARELWEDPDVYVCPTEDGSGWVFRTRYLTYAEPRGSTETTAIIAAIEAGGVTRTNTMTEYKDSPFHEVKIRVGTYGELSKIQEELDEAVDAAAQGIDLMVLIELSDIIGAVAGVAEQQYGFSLEQLIAFSEKVREIRSSEED